MRTTQVLGRSYGDSRFGKHGSVLRTPVITEAVVRLEEGSSSSRSHDRTRCFEETDLPSRGRCPVAASDN